MAFLDNYMSVKESRDYLAMSGVDWSCVWIRMQIGVGKIKSVKMLNARLIPRTELSRIIKQEKKRKDARMVLK
ncbi:MAG: hypothetical protein AAB815_01765 [Patescibacteria group bacterium]